MEGRVRTMRVVQVILAACVGTLAVASAASADTVATFADPSAGLPSLFEFTQTGPGAGTLAGGYSGSSLVLQTPGLPLIPNYPGAKFAMSTLASTSSFGPFYFMGAGSINFFDSLNNPLMTISFNSAILTNSVGLGASDFAGYGVTFSGPILNGFVIANEAFSFSFANKTVIDAQGSYRVTSSFTSSADLTIPAPGAAALLGLGGLIAVRRRR